jgi:hypothetical protein
MIFFDLIIGTYYPEDLKGFKTSAYSFNMFFKLFNSSYLPSEKLEGDGQV